MGDGIKSVPLQFNEVVTKGCPHLRRDLSIKRGKLNMSWGEIDLSSVSTDLEVLPEAILNFALVSAKPNKFDSEKVDVLAKVYDGELKGRTTFFSYPDPAKQDWSPGVFARLAKSVGIPIEKGEQPVAYINRAAAAGGKFTAPVKHRAVEVDGLPVTKSEVNIMKVKSYRG